MEKHREENPKPGNHNFLHLLRSSEDGGFEPQRQDATPEEQNADTLRTGNVDQAKTPTRNLSSLFDPPPPRQNSDELAKESPPRSSNSPQSVESPRPHSPTKSTLRTLRRPQSVSNRGRSVSFDNQASKSEYDATLQPNLPLTTETIELARGSSTHNHPGEIQFQRALSDRSLTVDDLQKQAPERILKIDDLLSSGRYETEAETNILRAFEEHLHQMPNHQRHQSDASSILSGVPDSMSHDFFIPDVAPSVDRQTDNNISFRQLEDLPEEEEEQVNDQVVPLVHRPPPLHTRQKSVGDRLVGLTLAMQTLDLPPAEENEAGQTVSSLDTANASLQHGRNRLASVEELIEGAIEESDGSDNDKSKIDVESQAASNGPQRTVRRGKFSMRRSNSVFRGAKDIVEDSEQMWKSFFRTRKYFIRRYVKNVGILLVLLLGVASLLFYALDNPLTKAVDQASVSWYLLFCARQIITLTLALVTQILVIDFLGVSTKILLRFVGQYGTLLIIMSRGWPFTVFMWSIYDFALLYGKRAFSSHWGYSQNTIGLFNESNPNGNIVSSTWNSRILFIALFVSLATALKRFVLGLYLGRQTFEHYGEKLAKVMGKMLVVSQLAHLARKMKKTSKLPENFGASFAVLRQVDSEEEGSSVDSTLRSGGGTADKTLDMSKTDPLTGRLDDLEKAKLNQLLGQWEEPDRLKAGAKAQVSISEVLRFRNALTFINNDYPFSYSFGLANSREATIRSGQQVYNRLLSLTPLQIHLQFETIAHIAIRNDGTVDFDKAKEAMKVFRPDREGNLEMLDFIKSVDSIYKEFRLLQASIENSSQIDRKFESIFNVAFHAIVVTIALSQVGVDPLALFLSFSSVLVAFAFMIGSASAKYFEGLLFVLARRPYGIGDIIHISNIEKDTSQDGSVGWIVNNVTLTQTTATWVPTLEVASFSNGSLSSSRIINWARSPNARFNVNLSFPVSTNYEKIEIFKRAVEEYLKVRPREWLALVGFRVSRIFSEQGYMQVVISVVHRDSWQNIGQVSDSKSNLVTYCHEVQKKLGMEYTAPPLPVDLSYRNSEVLSLLESQANAATNNDLVDQNSNNEAQEAYGNFQVQQFRTMAMKKYNIRVS